jgi:hypothetical protein
MMRYIWRAAILVSMMLLGCGGGSNPDGGLPDGGECPLGKENCGGECADLSSNPSHCGECFKACRPGEVCGGGQCLDECPEGLKDCDSACVDTQWSPDHCGVCFRKCEVRQLALPARRR